jgi:hypothetical protein
LLRFKKNNKGGDVRLAIESEAIDLAAAATVGGRAVRCGRKFGCLVRCVEKKNGAERLTFEDSRYCCRMFD